MCSEGQIFLWLSKYNENKLPGNEINEVKNQTYKIQA